uniref:ERAP1-like C-terminal domain-containing protein n=1 Tax=Scylla olivacea TaxID=85551 RepID=A0A0P4VPJ7_SCYOL
MAFTKDTGIRKQDVVRVFYSVASNTVGKDLAWTFLRDQLDDIIDYMGRGFSSLKWMIKATTNGMNKDLYLTELKQFQSANKDKLGFVKQAVSQAIETVANNIEWMNKNRQVITEWLENHGYLLTLRST